MTYYLTLDEQPAAADVEAVKRGLTAYNRQRAGDEKPCPLAVFLRDAEGTVVGGICGSTSWTWFSIDLLWIEEALRGQGHGHRLLEAAEREAVRRGCRNASLDTMSFQAPAFYRQHGYRVYGELADFPPGHSLFFMTKRLVPADDA